MALKHHWKFNGNLQDAVGDLHLTNVVGTPAYTSNKDGVANSCLDNSVDWYAYSNNTIELSDAQRSYSFWMQTPSPSEELFYIYQDKMFYIAKPYSNNSISLYYRADVNWGTVGSGLSGSLEGVIGDWIHVCITINNVGVKKMFINGILKGVVTNTIVPVDDISRSSVLINRLRYSYGAVFRGANPKNIDEFKYFDHILTDGGITTVEQIASVDSEVWLLYLDGVNNRPRYTLNEATNVTATTATVSWTK